MGNRGVYINHWRNSGMWEKIPEVLIEEPGFEWLIMDASHCKVHPYEAGAKGVNQDMSRTKGSSIQNSPCSGCEWYAAPHY